MPGCRSQSIPSFSPPPRGVVRLSRYVVDRRPMPRPVNDNRRVGAPQLWHWAVAIGVAPTLTAVLLLTRLL